MSHHSCSQPQYQDGGNMITAVVNATPYLNTSNAHTIYHIKMRTHLLNVLQKNTYNTCNYAALTSARRLKELHGSSDAELGILQHLLTQK